MSKQMQLVKKDAPNEPFQLKKKPGVLIHRVCDEFLPPYTNVKHCPKLYFTNRPAIYGCEKYGYRIYCAFRCGLYEQVCEKRGSCRFQDYLPKAARVELPWIKGDFRYAKPVDKNLLASLAPDDNAKSMAIANPCMKHNLTITPSIFVTQCGKIVGVTMISCGMPAGHDDSVLSKKELGDSDAFQAYVENLRLSMETCYYTE